MENNKRSHYSNSRSGNRSGGYSKKNYYRNNKSRNNSRRKHRGEHISRDRYIAKAKPGYVAPSIYVEDKFYEEFNISDILKKNIRRKQYKNPTLIQDQSIPEILAGKDILGLATTGSGKTGAFLIPMIDKVLNDRSQKVLIIVPTRELAFQIQEEFISLARDAGLYSALIIGGTKIGAQINKLKRRPEFVMGTPGRLKDLYERGVLDLGKFNNIVLDEVDRMLDMGFVPDITFLISKLREEKQTLFFSATMSPQAEKIANTLLQDPVRVQTEKEAPGANVDQDIVRCKQDEKLSTLEKILEQDEVRKVLIFSRTKRGADKLSKQLYQGGFRADSIHGDKSQNKRLNVLRKFKTNTINILVATDVAARGLDIPNVTHVINYDEPENYKDYIHRIGRTGRAGKAGKALTFVR